MKAMKMLSTLIIALFSISIGRSQDAKLNLRSFTNKLITASIKVYGKCDTCKKCIEDAVRVEGIKTASWNKSSQILTIEYDGRFINLDKVSYLVAAAGHDTERMKARDQVYNALPDCCKYQRIIQKFNY